MAKKKSNKQQQQQSSAQQGQSQSQKSAKNSDKNNQDDPVVDAVPVDAPEATTTSIMELLQVDVGDMTKVKQVLDETVAAALLDGSGGGSFSSADSFSSPGLDEDYFLDNIKLAIMTVACIFAVIAQFGPIPFPESRILLALCCGLYFVLSGLLQLITTYLDQDCILRTKPIATKGDSASKKKNPLLFQYGLKVRTNMLRFSEFFTVILEFKGMENTPMVKETWSVGNFFDVDGMFDELGLVERVEKLYRRLEASDYDESKKDK
mmetsp:Transcript_37076/g.56965  ORF Transcript_37076/g.56965 Transcript_37076/m.56965 type:complete len:264 (-) Transcript_37076:1301-2092(-)|eukprot:CAMPEP_0118674428 /NCGR_PEP_ID=MMETSP0800-20121206/882_1 /TAXON_ID=210618 ORGANISM="Striatella unipunctata, Strain CCMP2910" /NCGR_SAMPLE_ID=MMETSP0800 /ASSEMBLY_ACC=CAM_ASM_000638 /LENGTH=263 /DNA_ID=CAMNT_0006569621 /DNA_START=42 /DNA_END=833 /DNA_ORIENTATION=+